MTHSSPDWIALLRTFLDSRRAKGTRRVYAGILGSLLELGNPDQLRALDLTHWLWHPTPKGERPSVSTVRVRAKVLSSFLRFAHQHGAPKLAAAVTMPRASRPRPRGLLADERIRLLRAVADRPMEQAIVITGLLTGLRSAELLSLTPATCPDLGTHRIYTVDRKGGDSDTQELPAAAWDAILSMLHATGRPLDSLGTRERFFPISYPTLYRWLVEAGDRAGLQDFGPHSLRHTAAKMLLEAGATVPQVGAVLCHRDLSVTSTYCLALEGTRNPFAVRVAASLGLGDALGSVAPALREAGPLARIGTGAVALE